MASNAQALQKAQQANAIASQLIRGSAVRMKQQIFNQVFNPVNQNVVNVQPRYVGLLRYFIVEVSAVITNTSTTTDITLTDFGPANVLAQVQLVDLQNYVRIQTTGAHLAFLDAAKSRGPFGMAFVATTGMDTPIGYGSNWNVVSAPATIVHNGGGTATGTVTMRYLVPICYSDDDLRGGIYANVVNATMQLQLTINQNMVVAAGDNTNAVYTGAAGTCTSCTVSVYQCYFDQLPMANGSPILPTFDLSTIYEMKNTAFVGMTVGQDYPVQYPNFRDFLSTFAVYNNSGGATGRGVGADINYWALQAANTLNIFKQNPFLVALESRQIIGTDFPKGVYYFSSRNKPISTVQYGNMQLIINPATATAGNAYLNIFWEDFAMANMVVQAGSLPATA